MASAAVSRRVEKAVGYPPLSEIGESQCREFHEALLAADDFEDEVVVAQAVVSAGLFGQTPGRDPRVADVDQEPLRRVQEAASVSARVDG